MRRILFPTLLLLSQWIGTGQAMAQTAVCQNTSVQLDADGNASLPDQLLFLPEVDVVVSPSNGAPELNNVWQSFTPGVSGILDRITLTVEDLNAPTGLVLTIYNGQGTGGTVLHTQAIPSLSIGANVLSITSTLDLNAGSLYTFRINCTGGTFYPQRNNGNIYAGGLSSIGANFDLIFSTRMLQRPSIDNGSTSPSGIASFALSRNTFSCADGGSAQVTLTVTAKTGGTTTCISTVTVVDNTPPSAVCVSTFPPVTTSISFNKIESIPIPDNSPAGVSQPLTVLSTGYIVNMSVNVDITHTRVGDLIIYLQSPSGQVRTLVDRIGAPPGLGCTAGNMLISLNNSASVPVENAPCVSPLVGSFIPEESLSVYYNQSIQGVWTLTVVDAAGGAVGLLNSWSIDFDVFNSPGTYIPIALDVNGNGVLQLSDVDDGSDDNCTFSRSLSQSMFNCSHIGLNTITLTVTDAALNSATCDVLVEVTDIIAPTVVCQDMTLVLDGGGNATISVGDIDNGSSDACGIAVMQLDRTDFDCSDIGANTVILYVQDMHGNSGTCTATVTVVDNQNPVISCPASQTLCATEADGRVVNYADPVVVENCGYNVVQTSGVGLVSGSLFPVGTTNIAYTVTDDGGNTASCGFSVTVHARPFAGFTYLPACAGQPMFFTSTSTIQSGYSIVSHVWDMGDGSGPLTQVNPLFVYTASGTYNVTLTVTSSNGCVDQITQTVTVTETPVADFAAPPVCLGATTSFQNLTTSGAGYTGSVSYVWNFGDGSPVSNDVSPTHTYALSGVFTVTLTATNDEGCSHVIQRPVIVSALPQAQFISNTVCTGIATQFTDLSFGTNLSYAWDFGDLNSAIVQNPAHSYGSSGSFTATLTVTAPGGCQSTVSNQVTVLQSPQVSFTFDNACAGTAIQFTNTSDAGTYTWNLGDNTSSVLTDPLKTYPVEGLYDVTLTVLGAQSCSSSLTQTVEVYRNPTFVLDPTSALCFGESSGSLFVNPIPPVANFWDVSVNGSAPVTNQFLFSGLGAGTYNVVVTDELGCTGSGSAVIGQPSAPLALGTPVLTDLLCRGDNSGSLVISASGGTSPYTYAINGGSFQPNGSFTGLAANSYYVEAIDANGCSTSSPLYTITQPALLTLSLSSSSNLLCNSDNTGALTVVAGGGTSPYQYQLNGGSFGTSPVFNGLAAGTQTILVRDANNCEAPLTVTLTQPGILQLSVVNSSNILCNGQNTGTVTVAAAAGTAPYQYSRDGVNFQGSGQFTGLSVGAHTFYVRDANGCQTQISQTLTQPNPLGVQTTSTPVLCFGASTGSISAFATGGVLPYAYSFNGGASFLPVSSVSGLTAGSYTVVVRDANGCEASQGVELTSPSSQLLLSGNITPVGCQGGSNGSVQLTAVGGTPIYTFSANGVVFQSQNQFTGLSAGAYTFTVMDINSCQAQVTLEVTEPLNGVAITNMVVSNPSCGLSTNGAVTVQAAGGSPAYAYSSNGITFQPGAILSGLGVGSYSITVRDANGCTTSQEVTLTAPPALVINVVNVVGVECAGSFTGSMEVTGSGGVPGYTWSLSGGAPVTSGLFNELTNGVYNVRITDVNGCTTVLPVEVPFEYPVPVAEFTYIISGNAVVFNNLSQFGDTYLWHFGDGSTSTDMNPVHFYDVLGPYTVTLFVTNGCGTRTRTRSFNNLTLGVEEAVSATFTVYPNPATDELFLSFTGEVNGQTVVEVASVSGMTVMRHTIGPMAANGRARLDVSTLSQGMYLLRLQHSEGSSVIRFNVVR